MQCPTCEYYIKKNSRKALGFEQKKNSQFLIRMAVFKTGFYYAMVFLFKSAAVSLFIEKAGLSLFVKKRELIEIRSVC